MAGAGLARLVTAGGVTCSEGPGRRRRGRGAGAPAGPADSDLAAYQDQPQWVRQHPGRHGQWHWRPGTAPGQAARPAVGRSLRRPKC